MPAMLLGFRSQSCRSAHSPAPAVPPKAAGAWSLMSNTTLSPASTSDLAAFRMTALGYTDRSTRLFGEMKPPSLAQAAPAAELARYLIKACDCGVSLSMTATSPPAETEGGDELIEGKGKK